MNHEFKVEVSIYRRIVNGSRTFHVVDNARNIQMADTVLLKEWDDEPINATTLKPRGYTKEQLSFTVGFVENLGSSRVVFSLLPMPKSKKS